jgi:predicted RNA binding protein YcfA (HicA-like mRNA interferase family)
MKKEKLETRIMCIPPRRDITASELDSFLRDYGFELLRNADSAHPLYVHSKYKDIVVGFARPHGGKNEVKVGYIRNIQRIIEALIEREKEP